MSTIFKDIIDKKIPANIIYENEKVLAFEDINAVAPFHYLIIPKQEIKTINDATEEDKLLLGELLLAAKNIAKENNIDKDGFRLVINCNDNGGQTVFHLHMHLLGGRKLNWPPG